MLDMSIDSTDPYVMVEYDWYWLMDWRCIRKGRKPSNLERQFRLLLLLGWDVLTCFECMSENDISPSGFLDLSTFLETKMETQDDFLMKSAKFHAKVRVSPEEFTQKFDPQQAVSRDWHFCWAKAIQRGFCWLGHPRKEPLKKWCTRGTTNPPTSCVQPIDFNKIGIWLSELSTKCCRT